jgi:hypothetical protein
VLVGAVVVAVTAALVPVIEFGRFGVATVLGGAVGDIDDAEAFVERA